MIKLLHKFNLMGVGLIVLCSLLNIFWIWFNSEYLLPLLLIIILINALLTSNLLIYILIHWLLLEFLWLWLHRHDISYFTLICLVILNNICLSLEVLLLIIHISNSPLHLLLHIFHSLALCWLICCSRSLLVLLILLIVHYILRYNRACW